MLIFVLKFVLPSLVCLVAGGYLGFRWGASVEAKLWAAEVEALNLGKFVGNRLRSL